MSNLWEIIKKRYYEEYLEDKAYLLNVFDDFKSWHISFDTYISKFSIKEVLLLFWRIIKGLVVKVSFWWPFSILTYIWNLLIKYSFIPLQESLYYFVQMEGVSIKWKKVPVYFDYLVLFLRTTGGLTLLMSKILNFWHITRWEYIAKYERFELQEDDIVNLLNRWLAKLAPLGRARRRTKRFIIDKLIFKPWYLAKKWLNPKKYWVFRLFFYKKGRQLIYNLFFVYIRFPLWVYYRVTIAIIKHKIRVFRQIQIKRCYRNICFIFKLTKLLLNPELIKALIKCKFWRTVNLIAKTMLHIIHGLTVVCLIIGLPFLEIYIWVLYFFFIRRKVQIGYFNFRNLWYNAQYFFIDRKEKKSTAAAAKKKQPPGSH